MTGGSPLPAADARGAGVDQSLPRGGAGRTGTARAVLTTERQIAYWRRSGLLGGPGVSDLAQARTVAALRRAGISVARIRAALNRLRTVSTEGHGDDPLSGGFVSPGEPPSRATRLAVVAGELFIRHPDGGWEGDRRPGQLVLDGVLPLPDPALATDPTPIPPPRTGPPPSRAAPDREAILRFVTREDARPWPEPSERDPSGQS